MRQFVTGLFETYDDARRAQDALLLKGFAVTDIELPVPGASATSGAGDARGGAGVLAGIERFVSSLFTSRPTANEPPASADEETRASSLRFALQRGAVLIGVRVFDDAHATVARDTLIQQQALQVDLHAGDWQPGTPDAAAQREHSLLDELGIGGLTGTLRQQAGHRPVTTAPDDETLRTRYDELRDPARPGGVADRPADDPAVTALTPAGAPGAVDAPVMGGVESDAGAMPAGAPSLVPDEFLEYEEDFRGHHATHYQDEGAPFERYQDAYRYGAVLAQDVDNQGRSWDDIEADARRGWETMMPGAAPHYGWEQVRDAVRHGWERACAQGGCA
ncbi:MAG TPA: hypothetical protein VL689_10730 [Paraburkholderia sp.]|jgi:hypothetical protein|nr:hypothetical protein [Paraburkholderia sp.]